MLSGTEFLIGLGSGSIGLAVTVLLRSRRVDWALIWALCGLAGLTAGQRFGERQVVQALDLEPWVLAWTVSAFLIAAYGLAGAQNRPHLAAGFVASIIGVWATVPDTETISVLVGVTMAIIWSWWPLKFATPRALGGGAAAALAAWATIAGGGGRGIAVVGGVGIVAMLGVLGLMDRWSQRTSAWVVMAAHILLVGVWFTIARAQMTPLAAFAGGMFASGVVLGALWIGSNRHSNRIEHVEDPSDDTMAPVDPQ